MKSRILVGVACLALAGCAGGMGIIKAEDIEYPVSLSKSVFDHAGKPVIPTTGAVVGRFSFSLSQWTLLFTLVKLSGVERDISARLKQEIEAHGGNAIVNLTVTGRTDLFWYITSLVPILPTSCKITIAGDVVRL